MPFDFSRYLANLEEAKRRLDLPINADQLNQLMLLDAGLTPSDLASLAQPQLAPAQEVRIENADAEVVGELSALDQQRRSNPYYEAEKVRIEDYFYVLYRRRPEKANELGKRVKAAFCSSFGIEPLSERTSLPFGASANINVYPDYWLDDVLKRLEPTYPEHWGQL